VLLLLQAVTAINAANGKIKVSFRILFIFEREENYYRLSYSYQLRFLRGFSAL
jgi:hypothetical protein